MKFCVTTLLSQGLRDRGRLDHESTDKLDLNRLRARVGEKPRTKVGQIRQAWPEIKTLLDAGHSLKDVWAWVNEIGIRIGYARLSHYIGQLRLREHDSALTRKDLSVIPRYGSEQHLPNIRPLQPLPDPRNTPIIPLIRAENDPIANVRDREERPTGFQYNPEPEKKKLI